METKDKKPKRYRLVQTSELPPEEINDVCYVYDGPMKLPHFTKAEAEKMYQKLLEEILKETQIFLKNIRNINNR